MASFHNSKDDCTAAVSLKVKNTFVDLDEVVAACPPRRCASAPSSPRGKADVLGDVCLDRLRPAKKSSSEGSTLSCSDSEEDACSSQVCGVSVHSAELEPVAPPPPPPEACATRTSLRSVLKAKAWSPSEGRDTHMHKAIETVKSRMNRVRSLMNITSDWQTAPASGASAPSAVCTLTLMIAVEACQPVEQVLTHAKQAILTSVAEVGSLCVMGQRRSPFVSTRDGFAVMVGAMEDPNQACWDAYGKGFCARGTSCHWQHPKSMTHVNVNVVSVQTAATEAMYVAVPVPMDSFQGSMGLQGYFPAEGVMMVDEFGNPLVTQGYAEGGHFY